MNPVETLGLALGAGFSSGLNLYATIATLGLLQRFGIIHLPASLEALSSPLGNRHRRRALRDRVSGRQNPLFRHRLGRHPHVDSSSRRSTSCLRFRWCRATRMALGRSAARRRSRAHLPWNQSQRARRRELQSRAFLQLDLEFRRRSARRFPKLAGRRSSRRHHRARRCPARAIDLRPVPLLPLPPARAPTTPYRIDMVQNFVGGPQIRMLADEFASHQAREQLVILR